MDFNQSRPAILMFVDDHKADVDIVEVAFAAEKIRFVSEYYATLEDADKRLDDNTRPLPDMIFIDRYLSGPTPCGDALIERLCTNRERFAGCHVVCFSGGELDEKTKDFFTKIGLETFFPKPLKIENIKKLIAMANDYYYQVMREFQQKITV